MFHRRANPGRAAEETLSRALFSRLNVISIALPALRDRQEDIPVLTHSFSGHATRQFQAALRGVLPNTARLLAASTRPGNVRTLQNAIEPIVLLELDDTITSPHLPAEIPG